MSRPRKALLPPVASEREAAFTLIEILLVVVILLIATTVAIPVFRGSFGSLALRSTARQIIMAARYARARAALRSRQVALIFYLDQNRFEVAELAPEQTEVDIGDVVHDFEGLGLWGESPQQQLKQTLSYQVKSLLTRSAASGISLARVTIGEEAESYEGTAWVYFYPNGMCDAFRVELTDQHGHHLALSFSNRGQALISE